MPVSPTALPVDPASRARPAAGAVFTAVRRAGPCFRDELAGATGLSHATVNRQVAALLEAGVLRERPDLAPPGAVGRPRIPVQVNPDDFMVLGLHIGVRRATLTAADLGGRVLDAVDVPMPSGAAGEVIRLLARRLCAFGHRWSRRRVVGVGLAVGGEFDADRRRVRHPRLGWESVPVADLAAGVVGAEVTLIPQVEAMALADLLASGRPAAGRTLYVYARDAVGAALVTGESSVSTLGTISHLPVGGTAACHCGRTGCLEASAGDAAVTAAALEAGIVRDPSITAVVATAEVGHPGARELLIRRARLLGRGVALARDVLNPRQVVLIGQAFTRYRPALAEVAASFTATTVLEPLEVRVSPLGAGLQALAARTAALCPVDADPLRAVALAGAGRAARRACGG